MAAEAALQPGNEKVIHNLFTLCASDLLNNLWAACGRPVHEHRTSRMVDLDTRHIPTIGIARAKF
ncbi:MAG: hypothetical protein V4505_20235 [Pseudomonadota bacterium]